MEITIERALQKGLEAHKEGRIQDAESIYRDIIESKPSHPDANHNLGIIAVSVNKTNEAIPLFKTALEANPKKQQFWLSYIDALIKEKHFDNAEQVIEQAKNEGFDLRRLNSLKTQVITVNEPKDVSYFSPPQAQLDVLLGHYQNRQFDDAEKEALSITKEFPKHQFGWKILGILFDKSERNSESIKAHQTAIALSPQDAEAHNNLSSTLKKIGRLDDALISLNKALELNPEYIQAHKNLGITLLEIGRLDDALTSFKQVIKLKPFDAGVHINLGNTFKELGRLVEAKASYTHAIALKPDHFLAHNNLGVTLHDLGRLDESLKILSRAIILKSDNADSHYNLAITLQAMDRLDEAEINYRQAIALRPDHFSAHNNLGVTLQKMNKLDEAEVILRQSIALKPDYAETYFILGNIFILMDKFDEALKNSKQAIALKPDYAEAYNSLGMIFNKMNRKDEAIESCKEAININPNSKTSYFLMADIFKDIVQIKNTPGLIEIIFEIIERKAFGRLADIERVAIGQLKFEPAIKYALKKYSTGDISLSLQKILSSLSDIPLLMRFMQSCPISDLDIELLFINIRSSILLNISSIDNNSDILNFQQAIASQCFINQYLYDVTDEEHEALKILEYSVKECINRGDQPRPDELLCLASYKALNEYSFSHLIKFPFELESLRRTQLVEPEIEKKIKLDIPTLNGITDTVSRKVREQYEKDPYPQWADFELPLASITISQFIKAFKIKITDASINEIKNPKILIGGCGTGQHAIQVATRFSGCDVLAVDLSLSSLAYAKRKTEELGLTNIEYMQADILDLATLNRKFDIIECSGVLHHMNDPIKGWEALNACLKSGGLMKIGLYSELARQDIIQMRHEIKQSNIGSSDASIKLFRKKITSSEIKTHRSILFSPDFYSMSTLRDLLFHVQEHRFTINKIKNNLAQLGLTFCGFESDIVVYAFISQGFSGNALYDLDKWDTFEKENPGIFAGMYEFWCQKID